MQAWRLKDRATIVEIGSFKGRSTSALAFGCRGSHKTVFAIDSFAGNNSDFRKGDLFEADFFEEFKKNLKNVGVEPYVQAIRGDSRSVGKEWTLPIDFLFIDGSHVYEDVLADFGNFFPCVVPGGVVALHDVEPGHPGVVRAWCESVAPKLCKVGRVKSMAYGHKPRN